MRVPCRSGPRSMVHPTHVALSTWKWSGVMPMVREDQRGKPETLILCFENWIAISCLQSVIDSEGRADRDSPYGMRALKAPVLVIVTQAHQLEVLYKANSQAPQSPFSQIRVPLHTPWVSTSDGAAGPPASMSSQGGARICVKAAIGFSVHSAFSINRLQSPL